MADYGGGFFDNRHGQIVKDGGTTADFWLSAINNTIPKYK